MPRLTADFYARDARLVARDLLGHILVTELDGVRTSGIIIETEAYLGAGDEASHSRRGPTERAAPMFMAGGHAYVYFIYGMYYCFNVVTGEEGTGEAVLIRGVEPLEGIEAMRERRGIEPRKPLALSNGPGKLAIALGIGPALNGADLLTSREVWIERGTPLADGEVINTPRIGITKSVEHLWRWARSS